MSAASTVQERGLRSARAEDASAPGRSAPGRLASAGGYLFAGSGLLFLWQVRGEGHLTPETGLGYALGIAGAAAMIALLVYPLRKRLRFMRNWGGVEGWFRFHMILGLVAPALILVHCNFRLGSLNSRVALISMLVVAASGIIGRVIYKRIHFGLYGARATLGALRAIVENDARDAGAVLSVCPAARSRLVRFADESLAPASGVCRAGARILLIGPRVFGLRIGALHSLSTALSEEAERAGWDRARRRAERRAARSFVTSFLATVRKTVQLSFYERLFALWHVLHIPLFFLLLIATAVHVVAVHMY